LMSKVIALVLLLFPYGNFSILLHKAQLKITLSLCAFGRKTDKLSLNKIPQN